MENIYNIHIHIYPTYPKTTHEIRGLFSCRMRHPLVERWRGAFLYLFFLRWRSFGEPKDADLTWESDGYPGISAPTVLGAIYLEITWDGGLLDQSGRAKSRPTAPKWAQERFAKPKERFTRSMHAPRCLDSHKQCKDICTAPTSKLTYFRTLQNSFTRKAARLAFVSGNVDSWGAGPGSRAHIHIHHAEAALNSQFAWPQSHKEWAQKLLRRISQFVLARPQNSAKTLRTSKNMKLKEMVSHSIFQFRGKFL